VIVELSSVSSPSVTENLEKNARRAAVRLGDLATGVVFLNYALLVVLCAMTAERSGGADGTRIARHYAPGKERSLKPLA
jgi:hypothetical protein